MIPDGERFRKCEAASFVSTTAARAANHLMEVKNLITGPRQATHGDAFETYSKAAVLWNAWLEVRRDKYAKLTVYDVCQMLSLLKKARGESGAINPDDNLDDTGYSAFAGAVRGGNNPRNLVP